jgi:hypothetical protein
MPSPTRLEGGVQTNQRAELTAILRALETIDISQDLEICGPETGEPLARLVIANAGLTSPSGGYKPCRNEVAVPRRICLIKLWPLA